MPALLVGHERIAIIRERQSQDALSHHVGDAAERNAGLWLSVSIEDYVSMGLPAIGIGKHLDPSRGMKDTARSSVDQHLPDRICPRIYADNVHFL
jgi:hypothetical protein